MSGIDRLRRILCVCVGSLAFAAAAHAQVSPGPLANAHRELDTPLQCFQCHPKAGATAGAMDLRCLTCHTEVAWMKDHGRGFHARVTQPCAKCHPDHGGRDFKLVAWDEGAPDKFDHRRTGWALEGKHAALACRSCHKPDFQHSEATAKIRVHDRTQSWLGLETACASCHTDPHHGQLGAECQKCHVQTAWKPAPGFDHAKTAYPLTGKHAGVMCAKCHEAPQLALAHDTKGNAIPQYKPLPHADCISCHHDPHAGRFGKTCMSCHSTDSFQNIRKAGFNHDQTRYPLRGKHAALECATCHDEKTAWGRKPPFAACGSCHREMHARLATIAGKPADCSACHDVNGFHPSTFPLAQHQLSKFPLEGRHATILCNTCHAKQTASDAVTAALGDAHVVMRPVHDACIACHEDPHQGRFSAGGERAQAHGCLACHGMNGFRPSLVNVAMHAAFAFKLEGAHRAVPCQACHAELSVAPAASSLRSAHGASRVLRFADSRERCESCHASPHGDQFAARKDHGACESCHDQDSFKPASRFDHVHGASFALDGAHQRVACAACHRSEQTSAGRTRVMYRPVASRCVDCHTAGDPAHAPTPH